MSQKTSTSLHIARLQNRSGHYFEARETAKQACMEALLSDDRAAWLEAMRLYLQGFIELNEMDQAGFILEEVQKFANDNTDPSLQATTELIFGFYALNLGENTRAEIHLNLAIHLASQTKNIKTLAYAFFYEAYMCHADTARASALLEKVEVISGGEPLKELMISVRLLRAFLQTQMENYEQALHMLLDCFESAKMLGMVAAMSSALAQMARIHRDIGHQTLFKVYADLALCGIDKVRQPRLYQQLLAINPKHVVAVQYDIEVNEGKRMILERKKGSINFGNQHILLELALLLIKHPGKRFTKEDLTDKIWHQAYDPDVHDNLIYVSIKRLRTLLETAESPQYLLKDRKGYYFNPQSTIQFRSREENV